MLRAAARPLASGRAAGALVRARGRAARRREPVRVARRSRDFSRAGSASRDVHVLYDRPASAFVPMERAERERFRQALFGRLGVAERTGRLHRVPVELDRGRRLRRGHRRGRCGSRSGFAGGKRRAREPALSRSRHPRDRRRPAPRRVRAAVRRPAGAAHSAARAVARARRISARRRQRRPRAVPASILVGPRHSDEGGGSVRRRRAGLRAGLRRLSGRAGATRRQRPAVLDGAPARRHPVRSVRGLSRAIRRCSIASERLRARARTTWDEGPTREDELLIGETQTSLERPSCVCNAARLTHGSAPARNPPGDRRDRIVHRVRAEAARLAVGDQPPDSAARGGAGRAAVPARRPAGADDAGRREPGAARPARVSGRPRHRRRHHRSHARAARARCASPAA